ncbi:Gfo/Idh/MocA family protein [Rhodococcus opacus]|uniref:Gfo/Idh/MocA family protein n=1 Tax=Rhodococcus opacus TaxID=37919 RepID=UPI0002FCBDD5|nr:Gfo/Idh/MocA family oxidoreductase [Rhodococcus opacus]AHK29070.1 Trans-1,2-dihydrobenzene-1,2-diol dehydrogenase [Rhodococcus opacus PD630]UDG98889.1 Gfo/Idh/MocA family oxidoreductase [Rhodococcus opacus PD630]
MTQLRIGVLGASRIAELAIVKPAQILGHRLVAVAARDRGRAEAFARTHGVERVVDSYADLIADPEVDVIYNPLANAFHAEWNLKAIAAGKAVLTEKPFARNAAEAELVRNAARERNVPIMEGFHYLFHPIIGRMFALLGDGTLGVLQRVEVIMRMPEPKPDDPRWSFDLAGGAVMDLGCYGLHVHRQLGRFAGGEPTVVAARAVERDPGVDESCEIELVFPSGATGSSINAMTAERFEMTLRVVGDRGEAFAHDYALQSGDDRITITTDAGTTVEHLGTRSTYTYQLDVFAQHLADGTAFPIDVDDAVTTMELIDSTYRAAGLPLR